MSRRTRHGSRGIALLSALWLLAFLSIVLAAVSVALMIDVRRTREAETDAQLRQLLLAGAAEAATRLDDGSMAEDRRVAITLPEALQDRGAALTLRRERGEGTQTIVAVEAALDGRGASQTLRFTPDGGAWRPTEARLGPTRQTAIVGEE